MIVCQFKECNMLVVGLDNSGKSTILNHFMPEEQKRLDIVPTVGFNVEKFKSRDTYLLVRTVSCTLAKFRHWKMRSDIEVIHTVWVIIYLKGFVVMFPHALLVCQ